MRHCIEKISTKSYKNTNFEAEGNDKKGQFRKPGGLLGFFFRALLLSVVEL